MDLEIVILSEVSQTEEKYNIPYMWNLKRINANELTSENYLQIERMNHGCWGKAVEKGYLGSLEGACTHCCCSAPQSCPALYDPMDCSTPGFPIPPCLLEFAQTHFHWVGDAIQPSYLLLSPSPPAFNLFQHQGLFKWVSSLYQVAKILEFQL